MLIPMIHVLTMLARLLGPGGIKSVLDENLNVVGKTLVRNPANRYCRLRQMARAPAGR
jgi:hypothetical protein